jgi:hypothetical protein
MKTLIWVSLGMLSALLFLNVMLSFYPVARGMAYMPVDLEHPIQSREMGEFTYSEGWNFRLTQHHQINEQGFPSSHNYETGRPNIAVVGNSYVESLMLPQDKNMQEQLHAMLGDNKAVYGFGLSGSHAGAYNAMSSWVVKKFHPEKLIVVLTEGDFNSADTPSTGHSYINVANHRCEIKRVDRAPDSFVLKEIKKTAIYSYLMQNLQLKQQFSRVSHQFFKGANLSSTLTQAKSQHIKELSACFLKRMREDTAMEKENIFFVVDADREAIHKDRAPRVMDITLFSMLAKQEGFTIIDMQDVFQRDYKEHGERFDFKPIDAHWNERAHKLAAQQLALAIQSTTTAQQLALR